MKCTKCGKEFEPTPSLITRRWFWCIDCRKPRMDKHTVKATPEKIAQRDARNRADPVWRAKRALHQVAHRAVEKAIRNGILKRQPCAECDHQQAEAHHADYSKPLAVVWLCRSCHRRKHNPVYIHDRDRTLEVKRTAERLRSQRRWRDPEERRKKLARRRLQKAVAKGKILKDCCARCGAVDTVAHHTDYSRPFEVIWLCHFCHNAQHRSPPSAFSA